MASLSLSANVFQTKADLLFVTPLIFPKLYFVSAARFSMKVLWSCALVGITTALLGAQEQNASIETKIIAIEKAWNQAYKFRDKKALGEILDDSLVVVNDDGSVQSKALFLGTVDAARSSDEQQAEPGSISVRVFGDVAIATGIFREKGFKNGKAYVRRNRFVDTWINRNGSWMCAAASATPMLH
jgi:ketosteroid isomerase-like protein